MSVEQAIERTKSAPAQWLQLITQHILESGNVAVSLRQLAAVAGTSHALLSYYFGSRDGVLVAVLERLRSLDADALISDAPDRRTAMVRAWEHFTGPANDIEMKLLFYVSGRAVNDPVLHRTFGSGGTEVWVAALARLGEREGLRPEDAVADARLLLAAARGLALDRLLSGEAVVVDAAYRRLLDRVLGTDVGVPPG